MQGINHQKLTDFMDVDPDNVTIFTYMLTPESPILEWSPDEDRDKLIINSIHGFPNEGYTQLNLETGSGKIHSFASCEGSNIDLPCRLLFNEKIVFQLSGSGEILLMGSEIKTNYQQEGLLKGIKGFFGGMMFSKLKFIKEN